MIIIIVIKRVHISIDGHGVSINLDFYKVALEVWSTALVMVLTSLDSQMEFIDTA